MFLIFNVSCLFEFKQYISYLIYNSIFLKKTLISLLNIVHILLYKKYFYEFYTSVYFRYIVSNLGNFLKHLDFSLGPRDKYLKIKYVLKNLGIVCVYSPLKCALNECLICTKKVLKGHHKLYLLVGTIRGFSFVINIFNSGTNENLFHIAPKRCIFCGTAKKIGQIGYHKGKGTKMHKYCYIFSRLGREYCPFLLIFGR